MFIMDPNRLGEGGFIHWDLRLEHYATIHTPHGLPPVAHAHAILPGGMEYLVGAGVTVAALHDYVLMNGFRPAELKLPSVRRTRSRLILLISSLQYLGTHGEEVAGALWLLLNFLRAEGRAGA